MSALVPPMGWPLGAPDGSGALNWTSGEDCLREALWNLLLTSPGERLMRPAFGAGLRSFLNQPNTETTRQLIIDAITRAITTWETRVTLLGVTVEADPARPRFGADRCQLQRSHLAGRTAIATVAVAVVGRRLIHVAASPLPGRSKFRGPVPGSAQPHPGPHAGMDPDQSRRSRCRADRSVRLARRDDPVSPEPDPAATAPRVSRSAGDSDARCDAGTRPGLPRCAAGQCAAAADPGAAGAAHRGGLAGAVHQLDGTAADLAGCRADGQGAISRAGPGQARRHARAAARTLRHRRADTVRRTARLAGRRGDAVGHAGSGAVPGTGQAAEAGR